MKAIILICLVTVISVLDSSLISWIHISHENITKNLFIYLKETNLSRSNMNKAISHITFGIMSDTPDYSAQGFSILDQSISSYERFFSSFIKSGLIAKEDYKFRQTYGHFMTSLNELSIYAHSTDKTVSQKAYITKLNILFHDTDKHSRELEALISSHIVKISKNHEIQFIMVIWISALLLLTVCIILFFINKSRAAYSEALQINRNLLAGIIDNSSSLIYLFDTNGRCMLCNNATSSLLGHTTESIKGLKRSDFLSPDTALIHDKNDENVILSGVPFTYEESDSNPENPKSFLTVKFPIFDDKNKVYAVGGISTDITDRINSENELKKSLEEKEVLIRELYHRTKNNMQVIHSMLRLQSSQSNNTEVKNVLHEAGNKIMSMSLVHQKLYQEKNLSFITLNEYLTELIDLLIQSYSTLSKNIHVLTDLSEIQISIDAAIPLGLVVTELISNSMKYAFPDRDTGTITVSTSEAPDGIIELIYADDGIGVSDDFNFRNQNSLGLKIIYAITENQLQGKADFESTSGVKCVIRFNNSIHTSHRV